LSTKARVLTALVAGGMVVSVATPALAAPATPEGLREIQTRTSLLATHTFYQQTYQGLPVFGGYYTTHTAKDGTVTVTDSRRQVTGLAGTDADVTEQRAKSSVAGRLGRQPGSAKLVIVPGATATLAWETVTDRPSGAVRSLLDAGTGAVLSEKRIAHDATGTGQVFDPNPAVALQSGDLTDQSDAETDTLFRAYKQVLLTQLDDGKTTLQGRYANNLSEGAVTSGWRAYKYKRSQPGFEQVMAYHGITRAQEYIHTLGFTNVNNEPQDFYTTGFADDNSFYDPSDDSITFGTGGVDDAEDIEVIWHEYGHAIQDDQVPGFGESEDGAAIGEGFGDYWAVTMSQANSADTTVTPWPCVADWDSVSYTSGKPHCLRRTDGTKIYPRDVVHESHADGEIWSRALWDVNKALGRDTATKIVLEAHFSISPTTTMPAAAQATVNAANALSGAAAATTVRNAFAARGLLS
jgi:Zn-dependent metalloprotease